VIGQIVSIVSYQRLLDELGWCTMLNKGDIHHTGIEAFEGLRFWDFSHTEEMIEKGRKWAWNIQESTALSPPARLNFQSPDA
jgi:hypothetical protein